jgi:hypothetical protein
MSGAVLCAEYVPGVTVSEAAIPLSRWSHVAVIFGEDETRLYLGGRKAGVGQAPRRGSVRDRQRESREPY